MKTWRVVLLLGLVVPLVGGSRTASSLAQSDAAPCGYVDSFDFPFEDINIESTDFGVYRAKYGGRHTGIDVAFGHTGEPVRAAARGRVTYSDPAGWDTEKGVVVIQHTFPNGVMVNTLYGHMEELNDYTFPPMDSCVEKGDIIGAVGDPSLSSPHLHYEVRTRYRHEGGPGYTDVSPLELGWLDPVDFTFLARVWVNPAYRRHFSLIDAPTLPPLLLANGIYVIAHSEHLEGVDASGQVIWRFDTLGSVTDMLTLPDGRVLATTSVDQVLVLNNGVYSALWVQPQKWITPPIRFGNGVVAMADDYRMVAYTAEGALMWQTEPLGARARRWAVGGNRLALGLDNGELVIVDEAGGIANRMTFESLPVPFAEADDGFTILHGSVVERLDTGMNRMPLVDTGQSMNADAAYITDTANNFYLYTGEGRSLTAYDPAGNVRWIAYMPGSHSRSPLLGIGGGQLLYVVTTDGQLLVYRTSDGRLVTQLALYNGGVRGTTVARWLTVGVDDTVQFASGYLTVVTLAGLDLLTVNAANLN